MSDKKYIIISSLMMLIDLPVWVQGICIVLHTLGVSAISSLYIAMLSALIIGMLWSGKYALPGGFYARYLPILIPIFYSIGLLQCFSATARSING
ncbi:hypothetical protein [Budvicia diplopodorum]|uniref:hypothetical protein n=1 Tax=Budvicia diplopodorum TaxID=1119056 RepID=UPI00135AEF93|nr:hypothetical protein [Budvicia diplopodorum]